MPPLRSAGDMLTDILNAMRILKSLAHTQFGPGHATHPFSTSWWLCGASLEGPEITCVNYHMQNDVWGQNWRSESEAGDCVTAYGLVLLKKGIRSKVMVFVLAEVCKDVGDKVMVFVLAEMMDKMLRNSQGGWETFAKQGDFARDSNGKPGLCNAVI
ncbi:hypothetical protein DFH09DRAFT_1071639 [Mycena vulgaris]|nr:hypothetical protein DFH09DRAFT_1071639 [Mycena vulgaris]